MNKKIDFIICTNKHVFLEECLYYLSLLHRPEGYEVRVLTNEGATSMTAGYNEAMKSSDASIKVYMHQDVFITNPNFLNEIIRIFESDSLIGMIGMVGYTKVNMAGVMWLEKRIGEVSWYGQNQGDVPGKLHFDFDVNSDLNEVAIIDGLMMITSKDIEWDERFDGWDFYDASQSMRFLQKGYKVVVPSQKDTWVIHDDGKYLAVFDYGKYRDKFITYYEECLGKDSLEIRRLGNNKK